MDRAMLFAGSNRFRYKNSIMPTWRQTWARIQARVWSSEVFKVEIVPGEEQLQDLEKFSVGAWLQSLSTKKTCFRIEPVEDSQYTVKCIRNFDIVRFLVFLAGLLLFFFADSLSRSQVSFSTLLVLALARLPLSSSFSSFWPVFCQRKALFICSLLAAGHFVSMPSSWSSGISA
ncbi:unnamed protein product [Tetraodon nigroviridis]|uniref:(spotted green pufferfish) hypothetical protein n=1 Tax=Tetraodon nigroviridis TaxID=99883 RepID=Q4SBX5_TETNG|nr:unnamed protein product [Tetraodon nigroviridis]